VIAPIFVLDSTEQWLPVAVEPSLAAQGFSWTATGWQHDGQTVDRLDFAPTMVPTDFADLAPTAHYRIAHGGGLFWHQFWLWWPYNPKNYAGWGEHEGDWEMVQLGCIDELGESPVLMSCAQHDGGEKREFWRTTLERGQPLVYVARDSHACYFEPMRDVTDTADGDGEHLLVELLPFGRWDSWPGQWGHSANSPGPLATRRAWRAPHAWHGQCR